MTGCSVPGCHNRTEQGFHLYTVPVNILRRKIWIANLNLQCESSDRPRVCEKHFDPEQFQIKRNGQMGLKCNAVPISSHFNNNKNSEVTKEFEGSSQLISTNSNDWESKYKKLLKRYKCLLQIKRKISKNLHIANKKIFSMQKNLYSIFTEDQIHVLKSKKAKFSKCSKETLEKSLRLRFSCGSSGYNDLKKGGFPLPSIRTLNFHLQNLNFESGILTDVFKLLEIKLSNSNDKFEKDCIITLDEMEIKKSYDFSVSKNSFMGMVTLPNHKKEAASKVLVVMLAGITTRWKQTVAYYFTSDATDGSVLGQILMKIIGFATNIGLNIRCVTSDMGGTNQAMWRSLGIVCGKHFGIQNYIKNPVNQQDNIFFMADVPHLLKNIKSCLINNKHILIPRELQEKYNLPNRVVDIQYIQSFADHQEDMDLQFAPKLSSSQLQCDHFSKMKVSNSYHILNHNVSCGMKYISEETENRESLTTAWFVEKIYKWFKLMTSRCKSLALSKFNLQTYNETISFLNEVIYLFQNLEVVSRKSAKVIWKPIQTGVILSTKSVLDLQDFLLNNKKYQFILTSRFTQDCLENLFSQIRAVQPTPTALQFQHLIKLVSVSQFINTGRKGSYDEDDRINLSGFFDVFKRTEYTGKNLHDEKISLPDEWNNPKKDLSLAQQNILYNAAGYILKSTSKVVKCKTCISAVGSKKIILLPYTKLVSLKEFKPSAMYYVHENIFKMFVVIEQTFINLRNVLDFLKCDKFNLFEIIKTAVLREPQVAELVLPTCHNIKMKLIEKFIKFRFKIHSANLKKKLKKNNLRVRGSSKSVAMRQLAELYKV